LLFIEFLVFPISSYRRIFDPFEYESYEISKAYLLGKIAKTPFYWKSEKSNELLGLIHTNIYEPIMIFAMDGYTCLISDDHIGHDHVYLIKVSIIWKVQIIEIKLKKKLERVLIYFNRIEMVNTSAKNFKII